MPTQVRITCLYWIFALSGFSGLIYESIWSRYLGLFLGHAAYAQTLVLVIFMGGMAIGGWFCSRLSTRWKNLLLGYALVEGIIGVFALGFHEVFTIFISLFFDSVIPQIESASSINAIKWTIPAFLILPQSILLGMTFPLMTGGVIRRYPDRPGHKLAMLYFCNSIGAVFGVLTSGFFLLRLVGLPGTIRIAGTINLFLAVTVWWLGSGPERIVSVSDDQPVKNTNIVGVPSLLLVGLLTGTASFIYEIAWIRMLSMVLGSSTHSFELMLSAFILGLALGGLWVRSRIDKIDDPRRFLATAQIVMGILALSTLWTYAETFSVMQWLLKALPKTDSGYVLFNLSSHGIALAMMFPATFCAGMTLPLITYVLMRHGLGEKSIGAVYSVNTLGAITGVIFAVHVGMPLLGLKNLMLIGAGIDVSAGLLILYAFKDLRSSSFLPSAVAISAIVAAIFTSNMDPYRMASGVFRRAQSRLNPNAGDLVISHNDGQTATIDVVWRSTTVSIRTNGKVDAGINKDMQGRPTSDEATMVLSGALPLLVHPKAKRAANIGMGSGLTSQILLSTPLLEQLDTIEIEPRMVEGAKHFRPRNELAFVDPRSRIHIEDARTFFSSSLKKYDIIVSEPSNPWVSGVAGLFSKEFYKLITNHLNEDGVLVQWLQLYEIDVELLASVFKAISLHFDDFHVYSTNDSDILVVARRSGTVPRLDGSVLAENSKFAAELKRIGIATIEDLEIRKIADKKILTGWLDSVGVAANSDYYPKLDLDAERARFLDVTALALVFLREAPIPVLPMLGLIPELRPDVTITPARSSQLSRRIFGAGRIRDHILGRADENIPSEGTIIEERVKKLIKDCREGRPTAVDNLLSEIGFEMVPFLQLKDPIHFWQRIYELPCSKHITNEQAAWMRLFMAIERRDAQTMRELSEKLLETKLSLPQKAYLLSTAMLGNTIAGGKTIKQSFMMDPNRQDSQNWLFLLSYLEYLK